MIEAQIKILKIKTLEGHVRKLNLQMIAINESIPDYHFGVDDTRSVWCKNPLRNHIMCERHVDTGNCNCICHGAKT